MNETTEMSIEPLSDDGFPKGYGLESCVITVRVEGGKRGETERRRIGFMLYRDVGKIRQYSGTDMSWKTTKTEVTVPQLFKNVPRDRKRGTPAKSAITYAVQMANWQVAQDGKYDEDIAPQPVELRSIELPMAEDAVCRVRRVQIQLTPETAIAFDRLGAGLRQTTSRLDNGRPIDSEGSVLQFLLERLAETNPGAMIPEPVKEPPKKAAKEPKSVKAETAPFG